MKSYITFIDYFATGEGRTIELRYCQAKNKKSAIEKHLKFFEYLNEDVKNYFRYYIVAYDVNDPNLEITLKGLFEGNSEWIYKVLNKAAIDFHFKFHFNFN